MTWLMSLPVFRATIVRKKYCIPEVLSDLSLYQQFSNFPHSILTDPLVLYPCECAGSDDPLAGLGVEERDVCAQLAEMGFPLKRLASVAR